MDDFDSDAGLQPCNLLNIGSSYTIEIMDPSSRKVHTIMSFINESDLGIAKVPNRLSDLNKQQVL